MNEKEKALRPEDSDFSLEDILREFGDTVSEEPEEDIRIWDGRTPAKSGEDKPVSSDTVRLDEITRTVRRNTEPVAMEQTQRFGPVTEEPDLGQTRRFGPVAEEPELGQTRRFALVGQDDEEVVPEIPEAEEPAVEPYSEAWEPEYEEPMGEYEIPEPIVFRPKSRLGELKRKLVAGPEKRFYELSELGLGKLQAAILVSILVTVFAVGTTVLHALGVLGEERTKFVIFCQFISLLLSATLGSYQLMEGVGDLLRKRFSMNTLLLFALVVCVADCVLCLQEIRVPCCGTFSLCVTMSLWSACQRRDTETSQMDTMRKANRLNSVFSVPDYYEGKPGFLRGEGQVEDFMETYRTRSGPEKVLSGYALAALLVSCAIGVAAGVLHGLSFGVQAASAALLVAMPASVFVTLSRPKRILERRFHRLGTVFCGWDGVRELSRTAVFPLDHQDLFPGGSIKMNGMKFYTRTPDEVVAYAASLIDAGGGAVAPLFRQLLESRGLAACEAEQLRYYPGGIGAVICDEAVLAGTLQFMRSMGVEIPEGTRVSQAVYVSVDGELAGVFALTYGKVKNVIHGMNTLCSYRRLRPVLITTDFLLSENFLRSRFKCNTRRIAFPEMEVRQELADRDTQDGSPALAMSTHEGLAPLAYAVTGARALRSAAITGTVVHLLGGILGLVMMAILAVLNAAYLLTPVNVLVYGLVWMIPGLLITEWTRSI